MNSNNWIMNQPHAHMMANTWRLILERNPLFREQCQDTPNFARLEELLPEYRLIGLCMVHNNKQHRTN